MKKANYRPVFWLVVLCFAVTALWLLFLPDQIPMHYGAHGQVTRLGSKYEMLVFPGLAAVFGIIFRLLGRYTVRSSEPGTEPVLAGVCSVVLVFFLLLDIFFLWQAGRYNPDESKSPERMKLLLLGLGMLQLFLCNRMPKAPLNAFFGLRTRWSTRNPEIWRRCQRFGGYSGMACGLLMMLCGTILPGSAALAVAVGLTIGWGLIGTLASYFISQWE